MESEAATRPASPRPWTDAPGLLAELERRGHAGLQLCLAERVRAGGDARASAVLQMLQKQQPLVDGPPPGATPFLLQQIVDGALRLGLADLAASAARTLAGMAHPCFRLRWRRGGPARGLLRHLTGHADGVNGLTVTPDGYGAISAASDGSLIEWDLLQGGARRAFSGHTDRVSAVALLPPGEDRFVSASWDGTLRLWRRATGVCSAVLDAGGGPLRALAATPDGETLLAGGDAGILYLWDVTSGGLRARLRGHTEPITALAISADGGRAVSAADDRTLRIWDLRQEMSLQRFAVEGGYVGALAIMPDDAHLITGSDDRLLRLWDMARGAVLANWPGHPAAIRSLVTTPDGRRLLSVDNAGMLLVWRLADGHLEKRMSGHAGPLTAVAVTTDARRAVTASQDSTLALWDLTASQDEAGHRDGVTAICPAGDGIHFASAAEDGSLALWDPETGEIAQMVSHGSPILDLAPLPTGSGLISADEAGDLVRWPSGARGLGQPDVMAHHRGAATAVAVTADGARVVAGTENWALTVWDLANRARHAVLSGHRDEVLTVVALPRQDQCLSAGCDGVIHLWDLVSAQALRVYRGHDEAVAALALLPDDGGFVSAGDDGRLLVWNWQGGREAELQVDPSRAEDVVVSSDGRVLYSAWGNGYLHRHVLGAGPEPLSLWLESPPRTLALLDDRRLFVGNAAGEVALYSFEWVG